MDKTQVTNGQSADGLPKEDRDLIEKVRNAGGGLTGDDVRAAGTVEMMAKLKQAFVDQQVAANRLTASIKVYTVVLVMAAILQLVLTGAQVWQQRRDSKLFERIGRLEQKQETVEKHVRDAPTESDIRRLIREDNRDLNSRIRALETAKTRASRSARHH